METSTDLRVSDQERDRAGQLLREHFAAGRLTEDELKERVHSVYEARTQQQLQSLLSDLPDLPATRQEMKAEVAARRRHLQRRLFQEAGGAATPFIICTVIWLATGATGGFWPIWVAIPLIIMIVRNGWRLYGPSPEFDRVERYLEHRSHDHGHRHERRDQRRIERHQRRG
ncbi:MAG: DUF1707 domain-containing protein [Solirubrobacteraceae bacterium]